MTRYREIREVDREEAVRLMVEGAWELITVLVKSLPGRNFAGIEGPFETVIYILGRPV